MAKAKAFVVIRNLVRGLRRNLGLSPMQGVLRELRRRGFDPGERSALECFAFTGAMHTLDYARGVRELELWEVNPDHRSVLEDRFPGALVRSVDTYAEIHRRDRRFDLIVVDNSPVHGGHVEHFDLFPGIFRLMTDTAVMVLDVIPELNDAVREQYPEMFRDEVRRVRRWFYDVQDDRSVSERSMLLGYERRAAAAGFRIDWAFFRKRNPMLTYCVVKLSRVMMHAEPSVTEPAIDIGRIPL